MAFLACEGDPKIYNTGDGAEILVTNGQPTMDEGLENSAYLSLFSSSGWWGNILASDSEKFNSDFETISRRTLTNQTRLDAEEFAKSALSWMISEGMAKEIKVTASIPAVGFLGLVIEITQPEKTNTIKYQINWQTMAINRGLT